MISGVMKGLQHPGARTFSRWL